MKEDSGHTDRHHDGIIHLLYEDKHSFRNFVLVKLTDLKDLRVIKKNLEPEPEPKPQQNQPRKRSVELRSKEEEHARNEGLLKGQKVRMMDTNDTATLVGFGKDFYELELDGLIIPPVSPTSPFDKSELQRLFSKQPNPFGNFDNFLRKIDNAMLGKITDLCTS